MSPIIRGAIGAIQTAVAGANVGREGRGMSDGSENVAGVVTAGLLVIGDEILSGRTKDRNIGYIAEYLTAIWVDLREVRVVPDIEAEIVAAVNALRHRYDHLLTTGGIGPTHDDITADSVAKALGVSIDHDPRAVAILEERYGKADLNEARMRMASRCRPCPSSSASASSMAGAVEPK